MDTALPQKFPFILDKNLAKANCTENHLCTFCDILVLGFRLKNYDYAEKRSSKLNKRNIVPQEEKSL